MKTVTTPQGNCRFGIARCDITPPTGIYHRMWGAATHDQASGVHRPLSGTAMAFQPDAARPDAEPPLVLVALDHCLLWAREMHWLLDQVAEHTGVARQRLLITFSHTHAAGLVGCERGHLPGGDLIAPYLDRLARQISDIVQNALEAVAPVTITYATGRCAMAAERDYWDTDRQQFVCGFNPLGDADDTVVVARVTDPQQRELATIVNYACHPTTLAWQNTLISPDYPGAMRELVERARGTPCVFLQGASGDLGPRVGFVGDPDVADRNGRQLGYAALEALEAMPAPGTQFDYTGPVISGATIGTWTHRPLDDSRRARAASWLVRQWTLELDYRSELGTREQALADQQRWQSEEIAARERGDAERARDCGAMAERMTRLFHRLDQLPPGDRFHLPITLWRNGDAFWIAIESEYYQILQRSLRRQFPHHAVLVATLTNGARPSYVVPAECYGKGIYQESIALLAPGSLERVVDSIADAMRNIL